MTTTFTPAAPAAGHLRQRGAHAARARRRRDRQDRHRRSGGPRAPDPPRRREAGAGERVLFLTFSRTAVTQILDRSRGVLKDVADRVDVLTFHGFAWRLITDFGRYAGYGTGPAAAQRGRAQAARRRPGRSRLQRSAPGRPADRRPAGDRGLGWPTGGR